MKKAILLIQFTLIFYLQLLSQSTGFGPFTLTAPTDALNIQWYKDGVPINLANDVTYDATVKGVYWAEYDIGTSSDCMSIIAGYNVVMEDGTSNPIVLKGPAGQNTYQWYKGNQVLASEVNTTYTLVSDLTAVGEYHLVYNNTTCDIESEKFFVFVLEVCNDPNNYADACDFDMDGVPNGVDIDDDNDGIPDAMESYCTNGTATTNIANTVTTAASGHFEGIMAASGMSANYAVDFMDLQSDLATSNIYDGAGVHYVIDDSNGNGDYQTQITISPQGATYFQSVIWGPNLVENTDAENDNDEQDIVLTFSPTATATVIDPNGELDVADGSILISGSTIVQAAEFESDNSPTWSIKFDLIGETSDFVFTAAHTSVLGDLRDEGYSFIAFFCENLDTDNDGIVNAFDLDSDGDGCPDALEASVSPTTNIVSGDVVNGDGATNTTTIIDNAHFVFVSPNNDANGDGLHDDLDIDQNGVIDYNSTYENIAVDENQFGLNCPCTDTDLYADNCDFDLDGIPNGADIDDDNDGVLDTEECNSALLQVSFDFDEIADVISWSSVSYYSSQRPADNYSPLTTSAGLKYLPAIQIDESYGLSFQKSVDWSDGVYVIASRFINDLTPAGLAILPSSEGGGFAVFSTFNEEVSYTFPTVIGKEYVVKYEIGTIPYYYSNTRNFSPDLEFGVTGFTPMTEADIVTNNIFSYPTTAAAFSTTEANPTYLDPNWQIKEFTFTATSTTSELYFLSISSSHVAVLDNISVVESDICDDDNDGITNQFDLDSDNDGCSDAFEAGATTDLTVDYQFPTTNVGANGLDDSLEGSPEDGAVTYTSTYSTNALDDQIATCNAPPVITNYSSDPTASQNYVENGTGDVIDWDATDADGETENGGGLTYALTGADATLFTLDPATGVLTWNASPDFENPMDADMDNAYEVIVTVTDSNGGTDEQALTINVTNVNEAPDVTAMATVNYPENGTTPVDNAETADDNDTEGSGLTYTLTGTDASLFTIDADGNVEFIISPDFENPTDAGADNVYDIIINVEDSGALTDSTPMAITVTEVNEAPDVTATTAISYPENGTAVVDNAETTDDTNSENNGLTYTLTGPDAALFTIDADGNLEFITPPDFENSTDAGADNVYDVTINVEDAGGLTDSEDVVITITNVNEAPDVTAPATVNYAENATTDVLDAATTDDTDSEGSGLTYTLTGTDAALFAIDGNGVVTFLASPDFENPTDADTDNVYDIIINVEDSGTLTDSTPVAITVTNVNKAPDVTATTAISYPENGTTVVDNAETTDDTNSENNGLTYTVTGPDAALFTIDADGNLEFVSPPDYENPMDTGNDNVYDVTINVEDAGGLTDTEDVVITITDEGEGIIRLSCVDPTNDKIVLKNFGTSAQDISDYRFCAGADYTTGGIGLDMTITSGNLVLQPGETIELTGFMIDDTGSDLGIYYPTGDFANPTAMLDFTQWGSAGNPRENVAVAKGIWGLGDFITDNPEFCYTGDGTTENGVTFWDGNDLPVITSPNTATVPENTSIADIVIDVMSTDDNDSETNGLTYSFTGVGANSPDEGDFNIDPMTGEIIFLAVPDYENPTDDGTDNVYQVEVQVCDTGNPVVGCTPQIITITVTDIDEDGDGFTGVADPDDADPCVPSNASSPCCEAQAPIITKD